MNHLKLEYGKRCLTKSTNLAVLEIYEFILQNENTDTDYWRTNCGPEDLNRIFDEYFTELDWNELETDLKYWTTNQVEIFLYSIMNGYNYNLTYDNLSTDLVKRLTKIIPNKTDLILPILNIGIERGQLKNNIILTVIEEIHFLINHFDILLKKNKTYLTKIKKIIEIIGSNPELENKIEKANR